jgi:hypothetical protein
MNVSKVTTVLDLFFAFNYVENSDSLMVMENDYQDDFFRWEADTFKHDKILSAIVNKSRICLFKTESVQDRLRGNMEKIKSNPEKTKFGCDMRVVKDLLMCIPFAELTDEDQRLMDEERIEWEKGAEKRASELVEKDRNKQAIADSKKGYAKIPTK